MFFAVRGVGLEIGIGRVLGQHAAHTLENFGVNFAKIPGPRHLHFAKHRANVDQLALHVQLLDLPNSARQRKALANGGWRGNGADLLGACLFGVTCADGEILTILKDGKKLEA